MLNSMFCKFHIVMNPRGTLTKIPHKKPSGLHDILRTKECALCNWPAQPRKLTTWLLCWWHNVMLKPDWGKVEPTFLDKVTMAACVQNTSNCHLVWFLSFTLHCSKELQCLFAKPVLRTSCDHCIHNITFGCLLWSKTWCASSTRSTMFTKVLSKWRSKSGPTLRI
jgi:hypothetical protein